MFRFWRSLLSVLRWREWYNSKLPILFAVIYYALLKTNAEPVSGYLDAAMLAWITVCYAAFGYAINSWYDRKSDISAGKKNAFGSNKRAKAVILLLGLTLVGLFSSLIWFYSRPAVLLLVIIAYASALMYSMPPFRFKEHYLWGPVFSTIAQRSLPALYIIMYFQTWDAVTISLILLNTFVGFRYIMVHQIIDHDGDVRSGTTTLTTRIGDQKSRAIVRLVFPFELAALLVVLFNFSIQYALFAYMSVAYALYILMQWYMVPEYVGYKRSVVSYHILEDLYNVIIPVLLCVLLAAQDAYYVPLVFVSIILCVELVGRECTVIKVLIKTMLGKGYRSLLRQSKPDQSLMRRIEPAFESAKRALEKMQLPDGSFPSLMWRKGSNVEPSHGLFMTTNVLLISGDLLPLEVVAKAVTYIQSNKKSKGTWNFFNDNRIPDDVDDTACAIATIARFSPRLLIGNESQVLRQFWRNDGGPFQTWIDIEPSWSHRDRDDAVVNANVIMALRELKCEVSAEEINSVLTIIKQSLNGTRYYFATTTLNFAAVRAGFRSVDLPEAIRWRPLDRRKLLQQAEWMLAEGILHPKSIHEILNRQQPDGSWPAEAWFTGVGEPEWGSSALSTSLYLAVLSRCKDRWITGINSHQ